MKFTVEVSQWRHQMLDSEFQNAVNDYAAVALSYDSMAS